MEPTKILFFEDIDQLFEDEQEFYSQLTKIICTSKIQIILSVTDKAKTTKIINDYFSEIPHDFLDFSPQYIANVEQTLKSILDLHRIFQDIDAEVEEAPEVQWSLENPIRQLHYIQMGTFEKEREQLPTEEVAYADDESLEDIAGDLENLSEMIPVMERIK